MSHRIRATTSAVVPKVGGTAPLGAVKKKWAIGGRWSRYGRLAGERRPS